MVMAVVAPIGIREAVLRPGVVSNLLNLTMAAMFLQHTEARSLPRFVSRVSDARWNRYLKRVYGNDFSLTEGEVLDLGAFDFFYLDFAEASGLDLTDFALAGSCSTGTGIFQPPRTLRRNLKSACWRRKDKKGYPHDPCPGARGFVPTLPNTWVEVTHCALRSYEREYWTYRSRGSGIWLNTQRTIVYRDHDDGRGNESWRAFDSRQYVMPEYPCAPMEVVFAHGHGAETCGGITGLRRGFRAEHPFLCNASNSCLQLP